MPASNLSDLSEDELLQIAIRQSLEDGKDGDATRKRKRPAEVIEISDSDDEPEKFKVNEKLQVKKSLEVPIKKEARLADSGDSDLSNGTPGAKPASSFVADRAAMEKERLERQRKKAALAGQPEPPSSPVASASSFAPRTVPLSPGAPAAAYNSSFSKPGIYFTPYSARDPQTVALESLLDPANLRRAIVSSYDWDLDHLLNILRSFILSGKQLILGIPLNRDDPASPFNARGFRRVPGLPENVRAVVPGMLMFGAMHTKLMVLEFEKFLRVVVPSCKWVQETELAWSRMAASGLPSWLRQSRLVKRCDEQPAFYSASQSSA